MKRKIAMLFSSRYRGLAALLALAVWLFTVITLCESGWKGWTRKLCTSIFPESVGWERSGPTGQVLNDIFPIDVVYTWVNGSDPKLVADLARYKEELARETGAQPEQNRSAINAIGSDPANDIFSPSRFADKDELRYSLRSIERYAKWVRRVYIVTNGQIPDWLDLDHPRISVVAHEDIYPNKSHLPTFSSPSIECHLHRIPGLSKKFLYLNDDVFFTSPVWPEDFYTYSRGQKVYTSHGIPPCSPGCPSQWLADGYCDLACNTQECDYDGGDCTAQHASHFSSQTPLLSWPGAANAETCVPGCPLTWLADRYCDAACNKPECAMDAGDCGEEALKKNVHELTITNQMAKSKEPITFRLPKGTTSLFISFNEVMKTANEKVVAASHNNSTLVNFAVVYQHYGIVVALLQPNVSCQPLTFTLDTENQATSANQSNPSPLVFTIFVDTKEGNEKDGKDMISTECTDTAQQRTSERVSVPVRLQKFKPFQTLGMTSVSGAQQHNWTAAWMANWQDDFQPLPIPCPGLQLPANVTRALKVLEDEFQDGDITQKGLRKRKRTLLLPYSLNCTNETHPNDTSMHDLEPIDRQLVAELQRHAFPDSLPVQNDGSGPPNENGPFDKMNENNAEAGQILAGGVEGKDFAPIDAEEANEIYQVANVLGEPIRVGLGEGMYDPGRRKLMSIGPTGINRDASLEDSANIAPRGDMIGWLPWEKSGFFRKEANLLLQRMTSRSFQPIKTAGERILLDKFADSLRYVNKLYSETYGRAEREIIAHMAHMIDGAVAADLQAHFPRQFEETSAHRIRHAHDMQYAFSYMHFILSQPPLFNATELGLQVDYDGDGFLSANEIRGLAATLYALPLENDVISQLTNELQGCSDHPESEKVNISLKAFASCNFIALAAQNYTNSLRKYPAEKVDSGAVAMFHTIGNNVSAVRRQLDEVLKLRPKFCCLNDDIDYNQPHADEVTKLLRETYEAMFPLPSSFELPKGSRNKFLHLSDWRRWRARQELHRQVAGLLLLAMFVLSALAWQQRRRRRAAFGLPLHGERSRRGKEV